MHKCNFLEIINKFSLPTQGESRKNIRTEPNFAKLDKKLAFNSQDFCFFITDKQSSKTYLIRSPDNLIIGSIIHFHILLIKDSDQFSPKSSFLNSAEPEYSGIIEIAYCKGTSVKNYHSSLKSYSFKKQLLHIKHGRFNLYDIKTKDILSMNEFEASFEDKLDLVPQTNPFLFSLTKLDLKKIDMQIKSYIETIKDEDPESIFRPLVTLENIINPARVKSADRTEELVIIEEKRHSHSIFDQILQKLSNIGSTRKKQAIIFACDSDIKRRHWMITLKYHISQAQRSKINTKESSFLNPFEENFRASFNREVFFTDQSKEKESQTPVNIGGAMKIKKKKQNSISFKNKINNNPDYYDIYQNNEQQDAAIQNEIIQMKMKPLIAEPDVSKPIGTIHILYYLYNIFNLKIQKK